MEDREQDDGASKAPIEHWAEQKGLLPAMRSASQANPDYWKFAAARAFMQAKGWVPGQPVTEREFDDAVEGQGKQVSR